MLKLYFNMSDIHFAKLMEVYAEGNAENAADLYPNLERNIGILNAEQDFYQYLTTVFFCANGAFYAVWEEDATYISALRMEPYQNGLLLEALETHPKYRKQGYAKKLVSATLEYLAASEYIIIYSHINKSNAASIRTHLACGFQKVSDQATYIDGSVTNRSCTMAFTFKT